MLLLELTKSQTLVLCFLYILLYTTYHHFPYFHVV